MLKRLSIRNYVLIDSLETDFPEGLVIITGQTGAGKSILLGALSLLLGAKADASMIGESSDNCVVEGEFSVDDDEILNTLMEENEVDWDGKNITVRRVVNPTGRSRSFVNDCPVQVQFLSVLSSRLVDIHSQHQTLLLSDRHFQLSLLDRFAGNSAQLEKYRSHYRRYTSMKKELEDVEKAIARSRSEYDYDKSRLDRLVEAGLRENELEELEQEQKQLANAELIKETLCSAESILDAVPSSDGEVPLTALMRDAARSLEKIAVYVPEAGPLSERLESCRLELDDISGELSRINEDTVVSQERLAEVEDRLSLLYSLLRAFSCRDISELAAVRDALAESIAGMEVSDARRNELVRLLSAEEKELAAAAEALSAARKSAAGNLAAAIEKSVREMELPGAVFAVEVSPSELSAEGADTVSYRFSASGHNLTDVAKCASGGEMSRIMLALKAIMAEYGNMPTMIFDEIDTGVSGSVADKMGSVICRMGNFMQVFAITHLPQVAAKGSAHYVVTKSVVNGRTVSEMKRLSGEQRVLEIARMLSGSELTDAAIANARVLLGE